MAPNRLELLRAEKRRWKHWIQGWLKLAIAVARGPASVALDQHRQGHLDEPIQQFRDRQTGNYPYIVWDSFPGSDDERRWRCDVEYMINVLALASYKLLYPRARGDRLWLYKGPMRGGGNIHCRFCNEVLRSHASLGCDYSRHAVVYEHVRGCALESLAGLRTPVEPRAWRAGDA